MEGLRVGVTAARRASDLVAALERRGAEVLWGPTLGGDETDGGGLADDVAALCERRPAWVIASTGVGVRALVDAAERAGLRDVLVERLSAARAVARGAKAHGALRAIGVEPVFVSPQETDADTAAWVAAHVLPGDTVALLSHGGTADDAYAPVYAACAEVVEVRGYRSVPPADTGPARRLVAAVCDAEVDAITCTSPGAFRNLVAIAAEDGRAEPLLAALRERVAVAAVGPVTAIAVEDAGARVSVMPLRQRSADLVRALDGWASRGATVPPGPLRLVPQRCAVDVDGRRVDLGDRQFSLLAALVRRPAVVCPPDRLAVEVWGHAVPDEATAVKHQVSRVRRKLGPAGDTIQTVRGVGYRYDPHAADA